MPHPFERPVADQEKGHRRPRGVITRPAQPLPASTPPEGLEALREHLHGSRTQLDHIARLLARQGGGPPTLETATVTIPAAAQEQGFEPGAPGVFTQDRYRVPYASVIVVNPGAQPLTVSSGPPQGAAPGGGQGQFTVPACSYVALNITGSSLTVYGPSGATFAYSVMTHRIQPSAGQLGPPASAVVPATAAAAGNASAALPAGDSITGFVITAGLGGATATTATVTVTGAAGGTQTYYVAIPATGTPLPLDVDFLPPLAAATPATQITVTWTGNANTPEAAVVAQGTAS
jgi:hypothetical protein